LHLQIRNQRIFGQRVRVQIALSDDVAPACQPCGDRFRVDALRHHLQIQLLCDPQCRIDQRLGRSRVDCVGHKVLVDLDLVDCNILDFLEAGVSSPEVIKGNANAANAQVRDCGAGLCGVGADATFSDFDDQILWSESMLLKNAAQVTGQFWVFKNSHGQIDAEMSAKSGCLGCSLEFAHSFVSHVKREGHGQRAGFNPLDEFAKPEQAQPRMPPATQRLSTQEAAVVQSDLGLEPGNKFRLLKRTQQLCFEVHCCRSPGDRQVRHISSQANVAQQHRNQCLARERLFKQFDAAKIQLSSERGRELDRLQVKPADQDEPNLWRAPGERLHECHSIAARNTEVEHQRVDVFEYRLRNGYG